MVTVKDGAITGLNDGGQVDVSEETAAEAVEQAQSSGASQGVLRELRLRFLVERRPDGELRIAFADLGWETASLRNLSLLSLLVWALAMVGLFFVSLVLSSVALRPAERAWQQQRQFVADASHELKTPSPSFWPIPASSSPIPKTRWPPSPNGWSTPTTRRSR